MKLTIENSTNLKINNDRRLNFLKYLTSQQNDLTALFFRLLLI